MHRDKRAHGAVRTQHPACRAVAWRGVGLGSRRDDATVCPPICKNTNYKYNIPKRTDRRNPQPSASISCRFLGPERMA